MSYILETQDLCGNYKEQRANDRVSIHIGRALVYILPKRQ